MGNLLFTLTVYWATKAAGIPAILFRSREMALPEVEQNFFNSDYYAKRSLKALCETIEKIFGAKRSVIFLRSSAFLFFAAIAARRVPARQGSACRRRNARQDYDDVDAFVDLSLAGLDPSFLIGGIAENFGSSFHLGEGKHFILEGDEYDTAFFDKGPKFLHYFPDAIILTSVEFDHADIYKDLDAVETAFKRLVNLIPRRGRVIAFDGAVGDATESPSLERCLAKAFCPVERYGTGSRAHWRVTNLRLDPGRTTWTVLHNGQPWADLEFALAGEYNVWNATAAAVLASSCGISTAAITEALKTFKSVKRRLEVKAQVNGITIIDDFAHHPTAIAGTLKALRARYAGSRLWAVLEPRSNTLRRRVLQSELAHSLAGADEVIVANVFRSEAVPENERLELSALAAEIQQNGRPARLLADADTIVQTIAPELRGGDVVAILSNGGFGGIYEKLPARLRELMEKR